MKTAVYAISDIHGMEDLFKRALEKWDEESQQLVLIGDLADRGQKGKQCYYMGMKLAKEKGAIYLCGNHERMFLRFLKEPENYFQLYTLNGGIETLESFVFKGAADEFSPTEIAMMIKSQHRELLEFLENLPFYYEWEDYVFVHAGVDLSLSDWKKSNPKDFVWIREPFHQLPNKTGKIIVFGHTPTPHLHGDGRDCSLWIEDGKIGIDGAGVYGGVIHGVVFEKSGAMQDFIFENTTGGWKPRY